MATEAAAPIFTPQTNFWIGCGFALIVGLVIGNWWTRAAHGRITTFQSAFYLATGAGIAVLSNWNVPYVGPIHGICWIVSLFAASCLTQRAIVNDHASGLESFPTIVQQQFRAFVRSMISTRPIIEAQKAIQHRRQSLMREHDGRQRSGTGVMHDFIHSARDEAVHYLDDRKRLLKELVTNPDPMVLSQHLNSAFEGRLGNISLKILKLFETVTGQRDLWVALRILDERGGERKYKTIVRVGAVNADRSTTSVSIPEGEGLPSYLRKEYGAGRGIVVLGKARKQDQWITTVNDSRKEDQSVMAGPVIIKSVANRDEKKEMAMILYVSSPTADCFGDPHRDFMKCCTDTLSMFLSLASQLDGGLRIARGRPLTPSRP